MQVRFVLLIAYIYYFGTLIMNQMKKTPAIQSSDIHFRRRSRKRYAVFCSTGRCISIRPVSSRINDSSLKKQKSPSPMPPRQLAGEPEGCGEKEQAAGRRPSPLRYAEMLIQSPSPAAGDGGSFLFRKPDENTGGRIPSSCPSGFLFTCENDKFKL
jgi:hypothetical protein